MSQKNDIAAKHYHSAVDGKFIDVDLYCFEPGNNEVRLQADTGGGMSISFTVSADMAEGIARGLLEIAAVARASRNAEELA